MIHPYKPKADIAPYYPAALDIETTTAGTVIGIGFAWAVDNRRYYRSFGNWPEWWEFYTELIKDNPDHKQLRRVYAHNGANFDWLSFLVWAHKEPAIGMDNLKYIFSGTSGVGADVRLNGITIRLRDSLRLLPQSLAKLSVTFDIPHKKISIDILPEQLKRADPARYWNYLRNDTLAVQEIIKAFWDLIYAKVGSIDELPMTLPALAIKLWRATLTAPILTTWNEEIKELERRAYTGGRSECYQVGSAPVMVYDANSEYPAVMLSGEYPISYRGYRTKRYRGKHGIYHIRYRQPNQLLKPVLRDETTHEFSYEGDGVYTKPEIDKLLSVGGEIVEVVSGYVYQVMGNPFSQFISRWWAERLNAQRTGDQALAYVCKILMNSLYGKFGQQEYGWTLKLMPVSKMLELIKEGTPIMNVGPFVMVLEKRHSEYTFVAIAAYIAANARLHLFAAMEKAQLSGGILWATDTDSIHVENCPPVTTGKNLGEWKLEYSGNATYLGKKLYAYEDGTIKAKGIGIDGRDVLSYEVFTELAEGLLPAYELSFTTFPTPREVLSGKMSPCAPITRTRTIRPTVQENSPVPLIDTGLDARLELAFGPIRRARR